MKFEIKFDTYYNLNISCNKKALKNILSLIKYYTLDSDGPGKIYETKIFEKKVAADEQIVIPTIEIQEDEI